MSIFRGTIKSRLLKLETGLTVVMPCDYPAENQGEPCPAVYILHGLGGNHDSWTRYSNVERYARKYGIALIMPEAQRSFYTNMRYGRPMFDFITEELPALAASMFRISVKREDTYITGQSMGGYGALKCALTKPEQYAAAAGISGVTDFKTRFPVDFSDNTRAPDMQNIFGAEPRMIPEEDDLFVLAERTAKLPPADRPRIFTCCGAGDFLYTQNISFKTLMESLPYDYRWREWPGVHDWVFFDAAMRRALAFFFGDEEPCPS